MSILEDIEPRIYPWQTDQFDQVVRRIETDRFPHALLLAGQAGLGKRSFALALASLLLCREPGKGKPCRQCGPCHLMNAGNHPDLYVIEPEESHRDIRIAEIRALVGWVGQTSQQGGYKVVIVCPADAVNVNAGNALLKCLEEPRPRTSLILVCNQVDSVLATIRSRCQRLTFSQPKRALSLPWLTEQLADDADAESLLDFSRDRPLLAVEVAKGEFLTQRKILATGLKRIWQGDGFAIEVAANLSPYDPLEIVDILLFWLSDLLRLAMTKDEKSIRNKDMRDLFKQICTRLEPPRLIDFMDRVGEERAALLSPFNPNKQLMMENLMIQWAGLAGRD
jgi:DNA polymerase-3 subunit delta'